MLVKNLSPIEELADAQHHIQFLITDMFMNNPLEFTIANVMKLYAILEKLQKIYVTNLNWQHQRTIDSFFNFT